MKSSGLTQTDSNDHGTELHLDELRSAVEAIGQLVLPLLRQHMCRIR
jgi:hypothetical protein